MFSVMSTTYDTRYMHRDNRQSYFICAASRTASLAQAEQARERATKGGSEIGFTRGVTRGGVHVIVRLHHSTSAPLAASNNIDTSHSSTTPSCLGIPQTPVMPPALFTTHQSRWALHIIVISLSAIAIASSAPASAGGMSIHPTKYALS